MSRKLRKGFFGIWADAKLGRSWRWRSLLFAVLMITTGCSDDGSTAKTIVTGAVWSDAEETGAIASVAIDDRDMDSARVSVNDIALDYGLPLEFSTEAGLAVDTVVPVYYSDLAPLTSGDAVEFLAKGPGGNILFRHGAIKIPGRPILLDPTDGATLNVNEDVPVRWSEAANAQGYVSGYSESGAFEDAPAPDDDAGFYAEYVDSSSRELIVPFVYTVPGDALFWSTAVSGDVHVLSTEDDANESSFLAGASGWIEATIGDDVVESPELSGDPSEGRGSQGLRIVKEYSKKIKGYRFKVRECDPSQIQSPGTISLGFKLRRYKASIAFVTAYDINGNQYYEWNKARIYKSKSRKYYPSFSAKAGTTVVFGTHDASYRGGTYTY